MTTRFQLFQVQLFDIVRGHRPRLRLNHMDDEARQLTIDTEHLKLLRIGYMVSAGLHLLISLFFIAYAVFGFLIFPQFGGNGQAPPAFVGPMIGFIGVGIAALVIGMGVLQFITGQRLKEHRSRIFCMIVAALTCLSFPYGTFLGVCTFIVLSRSSVEKTFA